MARATFVKAAQKDYPDEGIKKGESYYWWKFRFGGRHVSKTPPKRSQLTQSAFYSAIYDLEDEIISNAEPNDSLPSVRDDVCSTLEDIKSGCEDSLSNMPEGLQSGSTGELLQERIDALESAIDEFEGLDLDEPSDDDLEIEELTKEEGETDEAFEQRKDDAKEEAIEAYWQSKLEEFQGVSIEAP